MSRTTHAAREAVDACRYYAGLIVGALAGVGKSDLLAVRFHPCFESLWLASHDDLHRALRAGEKLLIHCRGGLGRTGLVACCLLIELGMAPAEALRSVRAVRPGAVEPSQQRYVLHQEWRR